MLVNSLTVYKLRRMMMMMMMLMMVMMMMMISCCLCLKQDLLLNIFLHDCIYTVVLGCLTMIMILLCVWKVQDSKISSCHRQGHTCFDLCTVLAPAAGHSEHLVQLCPYNLLIALPNLHVWLWLFAVNPGSGQTLIAAG